MEAQKTVKEYNYAFKGNLNGPIFTSSIVFIIPIAFTLILLSMSLLGIFERLFSIGLVLSLLIYFFIKFGEENNLILFTPEGLVHYKKKSSDKFLYSEIHKIEISIQSRRQPSVHLKLRGKQFEFNLNKKNYYNFTFTEFAEYLLNIDSDILIIEEANTVKHRYSIKDGTVFKTKI